jgi:hypothetical protein
VFDDQHNLWINVFASVCVCSSQDAKVTWKGIEKRNTSKEDIMKITTEDQEVSSKSKKRRQVLPDGLSVPRASECPVAHRTVRCHMSNCPMRQGTVAQ